ncbi:MAG: hypothetical protein IAE85_16055 [Anaerolinea sp.]|nr:hypothetical protein [Anaerolinea sp.]
MQPLPPFPDLETLFAQAQPLAGLPTLIVIGVAVMVAVAALDWRLALAALMLVYVGLALLTANILPPQWALLRVITGGFAALIWYLSAQQAGWGGRFLPFRHSQGVQARPLASTTLFRGLLALTLALWLVVLRSQLPLPMLPADVRFAVFWLGAFGLLGLALGAEALQTGIALLLWLAATQLVVAVLQPTPDLIWLLSSLELLLALATGYLMIARGPLWADEPGGQE